MKARLLIHNDKIYRATHNGEVALITSREAREFLLHFNDERYYGSVSSDTRGPFPMESLEGSTVAEVTDNGFLIVKNDAAFRDIIVQAETKYISVSEFAENYGKSISMVRRMCQNDRIPGVLKVGNTYLIPFEAKYPKE